MPSTISQRITPVTWHLGSNRIAVLCGAAASSLLLSLAHRVDSWNCWGFIALVPVLIASDGRSIDWATISASVVTSLGIALLMFESIAAASPVALILAVLTQVPQVAIPLSVWVAASKHSKYLSQTVSFVTCWVVIEQIRAQPLLNGPYTSFYSLAYSQEPTTWLISTLHLPNWFSTALLLLSNVLIAFALRRSTHPLWLPILLALAFMLLPNLRLEARLEDESSEIQRNIHVIQPGSTPAEYAMAGANVHSHWQNLELIALVRSLQLHPDDVVLLPETQIRSHGGAIEIQRHLKSTGSIVLAGSDLSNLGKRSNSVIAIDTDGIEYIYNKWQLVPFYETRRFTPGNFVSVIEISPDLRVGIVICMDAVVPWLLKETVRAGADAIYVASATDYGRGYYTPELQLHLARHHAAQLNVPIFMSSSNGPSAVIDKNGHVINVLQQGQQGALIVTHTARGTSEQSF